MTCGLISKTHLALFTLTSTDIGSRRIRFITPVHPPRTNFQYANNIFTLASIVSEHLAGDEWEELIQERIFNPLGMTSSTFTYRHLPDLTDHATPYEKRDNVLVPIPWQMYR